MYKVIGLRVEQFMKTTCNGHNCDFEYGEELADRHVILLKDINTGEKVELTLYDEEGECGSGWCCASWAHYDWNVVESFAGRNYTVNKEVILDISEQQLENCYESTINNDVFSYSYNGGDGYYPSGSYYIEMELFTPSSDENN